MCWPLFNLMSCPSQDKWINSVLIISGGITAAAGVFQACPHPPTPRSSHLATAVRTLRAGCTSTLYLGLNRGLRCLITALLQLTATAVPGHAKNHDCRMNYPFFFCTRFMG